MKRVLYITLLAFLTFSFASCQTDNNERDTNFDRQNYRLEQNNTEILPNKLVRYRDGVYKGEGSTWKYGKEDATLVINDGRITSVVLRKLDVDGNEVDYDDWVGQEINGNIIPDLKEHRLEMARRILDAQTYNVAPIEGAGLSCESWKLAVKRALEKARE